MKTPHPVSLGAHQRRRIAVLACVDPRTVERFLAGLPIRSTCQARIEQALENLGGERAFASLRTAR